MHTHSCCKSFHGNLSSHPLHCSTATLHTHTQGKLRHDDGCVEISPTPTASKSADYQRRLLVHAPLHDDDADVLSRLSSASPKTPSEERNSAKHTLPPKASRYGRAKCGATRPPTIPTPRAPGRYTRSQAIARVATTPAAVKWPFSSFGAASPQRMLGTACLPKPVLKTPLKTC
jgi:hypothetical protein